MGVRGLWEALIHRSRIARAARPCAAGNSGIFRSFLCFGALCALSAPAPAAAGQAEVLLVDALSGTPRSGVDVHARERLGDGKSTWRAKTATGADGIARFELAGLGSGARYYFLANASDSGWLESAEITAPGRVRLEVGQLPVTAVSGADGEPLANRDITLVEVLANDEQRWISRVETDASGQAVFDAPGLGQGRRYRLKAQSTIDQSWKYSAILETAGAFRFTVGNAPLAVRVEDFHSGAALAGIEITVRERVADGTHWVTRRTADADGRLTLDLDGLGAGRVYELKAQPYNGGWAVSDALTATGEYRFRLGKLPVRLVAGDTGQALAGVQLVVIRKEWNGERKWQNDGMTDAGGTVRFDPTDLGGGPIYVIKAVNPFGDGEHYYSDWITAPAKFDFELTRDQPLQPDFRPPQITLIEPVAGARIGTGGMRVLGVAHDRVGVDGVRLRIARGDVVEFVHAELFADTGFWRATVPAAAIGGPGPVSVRAFAWDAAKNGAVAEVAVEVFEDGAAPDLSLAAPDVSWTGGAVISGSISDNSQIANLRATLTGSQTRSLELDFPPRGGAFQVPLPSGVAAPGETLDLRVEATDFSGNRRTRSVTLAVVEEPIDSMQLARRASFGPTPELLAAIRATGVEDWLNGQLDPNLDPGAELAAALAELGPVDSRSDLQNWWLTHMRLSAAQLRELMTWFWDNHFNTDLNKHGNWGWELAEIEAFRANAFGGFRTLLGISAKSPAMLKYLDNATSRKENPNENYPRELLELHTMGVDGGYTQDDVEEVARALTGWTVREGAFQFRSHWHDNGEKTVLGHVLAAGRGVEDGEDVLDILAAHPSTAHHVCTKLLQLFVRDDPHADAIDECAGVFMDTDGHIGTVVSHILHSPAFSDLANAQMKVRTPLESVLATSRALGVVQGRNGMRAALEDLGMPLMQNPVPTGYAETGERWTHSNQLLARVRLGSELAFARPGEYRNHLLDPLGALNAQGHTTADGIAGALAERLFAHDYSDVEWSVLRGALAPANDLPFGHLDAEAADERVRTAIALALGFPAFHLQ
ncbi:MAG: DUF1800 domain-containing protein [Chromatiales bacterium]|nr:DUF1800 domain-containing protein [Chromatiales bacterium]